MNVDFALCKVKIFFISVMRSELKHILGYSQTEHRRAAVAPEKIKPLRKLPVNPLLAQRPRFRETYATCSEIAQVPFPPYSNLDGYSL